RSAAEGGGRAAAQEVEEVVGRREDPEEADAEEGPKEEEAGRRRDERGLPERLRAGHDARHADPRAPVASAPAPALHARAEPVPRRDAAARRAEDRVRSARRRSVEPDEAGGQALRRRARRSPWSPTRARAPDLHPAAHQTEVPAVE